MPGRVDITLITKKKINLIINSIAKFIEIDNNSQLTQVCSTTCKASAKKKQLCAIETKLKDTKSFNKII